MSRGEDKLVLFLGAGGTFPADSNRHLCALVPFDRCSIAAWRFPGAYSGTWCPLNGANTSHTVSPWQASIAIWCFPLGMPQHQLGEPRVPGLFRVAAPLQRSRGLRDTPGSGEDELLAVDETTSSLFPQP